MTKTRIFSISLIPVIIFLSYLLYRGIAGKIEEAEAIKRSEARVIERLKNIREAQRAYLSKYGRYTTSFDTLVNFVKTDSLYITQKREIIIPRNPKDPRYYLGDSIRVEIDTLGIEMVLSSVFPSEKFPNFNPDRLPFVPGYDPAENKKFELFADKILKGRLLVDVIEVVDPYPMDKTRSDKHPSPVRWRLRFGSRTETTTSGNWE
jgi:hypothetical protein